MSERGTVRDWEACGLLDRLYWRDVVAFASIAIACRQRGMTMIQRVRQRLDELKKEKHERIRAGAPVVDMLDNYYCGLSVCQGSTDDLPHASDRPDV